MGTGSSVVELSRAQADEHVKRINDKRRAELALSVDEQYTGDRGDSAVSQTSPEEAGDDKNTKKQRERVQAKTQKISKIKVDGKNDSEVRQYFEDIQKLFDSVNDSTNVAKLKRRAEIVKFLSECGSVNIICDFIAGSLESENYVRVDQQSKERVVVKQCFEALMAALEILSKCLKVREEVAQEVVKHSRLLPIILTKLRDVWNPVHMDKSLSRLENEVVVRESLYIVHYVAMSEDVVPRLRELTPSVLDVMKGYLKFPQKECRLTAIATLADVMTENEAELFSKDMGMINLLLQHLRSALRNRETHVSEGWSSLELLRVVQQLEQKDSFKRPLVEANILPILEDGVESTTQDEQKESLIVVWTLSFNKENAGDILKRQKLVDTLIDLLEKPIQTDVSTVIRGILWNLRTELNKGTTKSNKIAEIIPAPHHGTGKTSDREPHVMLSYQHEHQPVVEKIYHLLKESRFKIWMDKFEMRKDSLLQLMAEAVECSFVVLPCISKSYKKSPHCQSEAEYAYKLKKPVIPLILETGYEPDGWLGILTANKYYYDFSECDEAEFKQLGAKLVEAIEKVSSDAKGKQPRGKKEKANHVPHGETRNDHSFANRSSLDNGEIKDWSRHEVQKWLERANVTRQNVYRNAPFVMDSLHMYHCSYCHHWHRRSLDPRRRFERTSMLNSLNGEQLCFLRRMRSQVPEAYYTTLRENLQVRCFYEMVKFSKALDDLHSE